MRMFDKPNSFRASSNTVPAVYIQEEVIPRLQRLLCSLNTMVISLSSKKGESPIFTKSKEVLAECCQTITSITNKDVPENNSGHSSSFSPR